jgi:hypothetical protein
LCKISLKLNGCQMVELLATDGATHLQALWNWNYSPRMELSTSRLCCEIECWCFLLPWPVCVSKGRFIAGGTKKKIDWFADVHQSIAIALLFGLLWDNQQNVIV